MNETKYNNLQAKYADLLEHTKHNASHNKGITYHISNDSMLTTQCGSIHMFMALHELKQFKALADVTVNNADIKIVEHDYKYHVKKSYASYVHKESKTKVYGLQKCAKCKRLFNITDTYKPLHFNNTDIYLCNGCKPKHIEMPVFLAFYSLEQCKPNIYLDLSESDISLIEGIEKAIINHVNYRAFRVVKDDYNVYLIRLNNHYYKHDVQGYCRLNKVNKTNFKSYKQFTKLEHMFYKSHVITKMQINESMLKSIDLLTDKEITQYKENANNHSLLYTRKSKTYKLVLVDSNNGMDLYFHLYLRKYMLKESKVLSDIVYTHAVEGFDMATNTLNSYYIW